MSNSDNWVQRLEAALDRGSTATGSELQLLLGQRPPVLDAAGRQALLSPVLAGFFWSAAVFRETLEDSPLDPMALLLRLLALALSVRAVLGLLSLARRMRLSSQRRRYALALCDEGLMLRTPAGDFPVARQDVVSITEHGRFQARSGRRWADVYLVTRAGSGRGWLTLPPFFDASPGALSERLMRWLGVPEATEHEGPAPEPAPLASKLFDEVADGARPPRTTVIEHGPGWLRRGPYATILLGVAVLDGYLRLPATTRDTVGSIAPTVIIVALVIVPLLWFLITRYDIAPRKGIALILTPAEMLMRTRAGVHRVLWSEVDRLEITSRRSWSVIRGQHDARSLVIHRKDDDSITYVEAFLGAPAEVVLALCEAYRDRKL